MRRFRALCLVLFFFVIASGPGWAKTQGDPSVGALSPNARQLFLATMDLGDKQWNAKLGLLCGSPCSDGTVRESADYALGLLLRDGKGDTARAAQTINAVLGQQYHDPGKPFNGTYRRSTSDPYPPADAVIWRDFDPNWREFIGTTLLIIVKEFPDRLPAGLAARMDSAIVQSVAGEIKNGRLVPTYTNPALMYGILWQYAAGVGHHPEWVRQSSEWQKTVYRLFKENNTFYEYNSPTYCGVDLYALGLWRRYGTPVTQAMGITMEVALWHDLASFYNANLENISGPFDRAYGMDMRSYVSLVGIALRNVLDARLAPLPPLDPVIDPNTDHIGDVWLSPHFAILGVHVPADALQSFLAFQGKRVVTRKITSDRTAEAMIYKNVMYGGESTRKTKDISGDSQFHAATVQWRTPSGKIGWIELTKAPPVDVTVDEHGVNISCAGSVTLLIHAEGLSLASVKQGEWKLPGLDTHVTADARNFIATSSGHDVEVEYFDVTGMKLQIPASAR